jgi:hypothetical protein
MGHLGSLSLDQRVLFQPNPEGKEYSLRSMFALEAPVGVAYGSYRGVTGLFSSYFSYDAIYFFSQDSGTSELVAGTLDVQGSDDGPRLECTLANPSRMAFDSTNNRLFVMELETGHVRVVDFVTDQVYRLRTTDGQNVVFPIPAQMSGFFPGFDIQFGNNVLYIATTFGVYSISSKTGNIADLPIQSVVTQYASVNEYMRVHGYPSDSFIYSVTLNTRRNHLYVSVSCSKNVILAVPINAVAQKEYNQISVLVGDESNTFVIDEGSAPSIVNGYYGYDPADVKLAFPMHIRYHAATDCVYFTEAFPVTSVPSNYFGSLSVRRINVQTLMVDSFIGIDFSNGSPDYGVVGTTGGDADGPVQYASFTYPMTLDVSSSVDSDGFPAIIVADFSISYVRGTYVYTIPTVQPTLEPTPSPTTAAQFFTEAPTRLEQFRTSPPTRPEQFVTSAPTRESQFHTEAPTRVDQFHTEAPTKTEQFHTEAPTRIEQLPRSPQPTQATALHTEAPTLVQQFHTDAPTRVEQFLTAAPTTTAQHRINPAPTTADAFYTDAPTRVAQFHTEAPTKTEQFHTEAPTRIEQLPRSPQPTQAAAFHTEAPTLVQQFHTDAPTRVEQFLTAAPTTTAQHRINPAPTTADAFYTDAPTRVAQFHTEAPTKTEQFVTPVPTSNVAETSAPTRVEQFVTRQPTVAEQLETPAPSTESQHRVREPTAPNQFLTEAPTRVEQFLTAAPTVSAQFVTPAPTRAEQLVTPMPTTEEMFVTSAPTRVEQFTTSIPTADAQFRTNAPTSASQFVTPVPTKLEQFLTSAPTKVEQFVTSIPTTVDQFRTAVPTVPRPTRAPTSAPTAPLGPEFNPNKNSNNDPMAFGSPLFIAVVAISGLLFFALLVLLAALLHTIRQRKIQENSTEESETEKASLLDMVRAAFLSAAGFRSVPTNESTGLLSQQRSSDGGLDIDDIDLEINSESGVGDLEDGRGSANGSGSAHKKPIVDSLEIDTSTHSSTGLMEANDNHGGRAIDAFEINTGFGSD